MRRAATGGLSLGETQQALAVFARQPTLAAIEVCAYNPALDPEGAAARRVIELLVEVLSPRLEEGSAAAEPKQEVVAAPTAASDQAAPSAEKSLAEDTPTPSTPPASPEEMATPPATDSAAPSDTENSSS